MDTQRQIPEIYVMQQNRRDLLGIVKNYTEFVEDIRFNACSEIQFKVANKYYDIDLEQWVNNPYYDCLERNRLIYITDDNSYFKYPVKAIGDSSFYKYVFNKAQYRRGAQMAFEQNDHLSGFQVQPETELFDAGRGGGYSFQHFAFIDTGYHGSYGNPGAVLDYSHLHWGAGAAEFNPMLALDVYFPVESTDVLAVYNGDTSSADNVWKPEFTWHIAAYTREDATAYVDSWDVVGGVNQRINIAEHLPNGGYLRFWYECSSDVSSYTYNPSGDSHCTWYSPDQGYVKIFSGERRCSSISNTPAGGYVYPKMRWFQIVSVDEVDDGFARTKTVTAYSYEYSLKAFTFSLSATTLPFYIPEAITNLVESNSWVRDFYEGGSKFYSAQIMKTGVLNQILEYLPGWTVKYVSSTLMARYRSLDDVDDVNIYSYLMGTLQSVYNCFIVFDNDDKTISAYDLSDINDMKSSFCLTWQNAIQNFEKQNIDASYFSALRVHAGDDQYGIGLINPSGNGMIYNFDNISGDINYTIPNVPSTYSRSLRTALTNWTTEYDKQSAHGTNGLTYYDYGKLLAEANMELIRAEGERDTALHEYLAEAGVINALLLDDIKQGRLENLAYVVVRLTERPLLSSTILNRPIERFHDATHWNKLYQCALSYEQAKGRCTIAEINVNSTKNAMRNIAKKLTLNYKTALEANGGDVYKYSSSTTLLSAAEIKELMNYVVEGTWVYENLAFTELYNADDIVSALSSVKDAAKFDLDNRLSIANFDFSIDSANVLAIPEFDAAKRGLYMANKFTLMVSDDEVITPLLLALHINYKDDSDFSFTFTTDMKRRPDQFRFADLYSTIQQTSVTDNGFTFDT